jgi:hypothetical protein
LLSLSRQDLTAVDSEEWETLLDSLEVVGVDSQAFCRRALSQLVGALPSETRLQEAWLVWENRCAGSDAAKELAKSLLSKERDNLALWRRYAQLEAAAGHKAEAVRVYDLALSTAKPDQRDYLALAFSFGKFLLMDGKQSRALSVIVSATHASVNASTTDKPTPTELVRVRRALEELRRSPEMFCAAVSCQCLFEYLAHGVEQMITAFRGAMEDTEKIGASELEIEMAAEAFISLYAWHTGLPDARFPTTPREFRATLQSAIARFPAHPHFAGLLIGSETRPGLGIPFHLRVYIDTVISAHPWPFIPLAWLSSAVTTSGSLAAATCERVLAATPDGNDQKQCAALWLQLISQYLSYSQKNAKQAYVRAIRHVPWSKRVWLTCFREPALLSCLSATDLKDILSLAQEKGIRMRTEPPSL